MLNRGKIKYYVAAMRLRTLPLSMAGVCLGLMLAVADFHVRWEVVLFAFCGKSLGGEI